MTEYKKVSESATVLTELMIPSYSNFGGKIHGGVILSLMDKVAYVCAAKHADTYCVTAAIERVDFLAPVEIGDLVSLMASVNYTGKSSVVVGIRVTSENIKTRRVKHTNTSYFTMVAKNEEGKPTPVPGLLLESREDARRFLEAITRREIKSESEQYFLQQKDRSPVETALTILANERCKIGFM